MIFDTAQTRIRKYVETVYWPQVWELVSTPVYHLHYKANEHMPQTQKLWNLNRKIFGINIEPEFIKIESINL